MSHIKPIQYAKAKAHDDAMRSQRHSIIEPKLDGVRLFVVTSSQGVVLLTKHMREGHNMEVTNKFPQIANLSVLRTIGEQVGLTILDGELVAQGSQDTFTPIVSMINASDKYADHLASTLLIQPTFHAFDVLRWNTSRIDYSWRVRRSLLENITTNNLLRLVPYREELSVAGRRRAYHEYLKAGYEGVVHKNPDATYLESGAWLKTKPVISIDLQVTGWKPGQGKYAGSVGSLEFSGFDSNRVLKPFVYCSPGTDAKRAELYQQFESLDDSAICQMRLIAEITGQRFTPDNRSLRHPRITRWRPDKWEPNPLP